MPICHICGLDKPSEKFSFIKKFKTWKSRDVVWCQECQKMYIEMRQQEVKKKVYEEMKFSGLVEFK